MCVENLQSSTKISKFTGHVIAGFDNLKTGFCEFMLVESPNKTQLFVGSGVGLGGVGERK